MYTVIYSKSPYLLARMATDLQMEGWRNDEGWNNIYNPFSKLSYGVVKYIELGSEDGKTFSFFTHKCEGNPIRHTLTSRNYLKVLGAILNSKK